MDNVEMPKLLEFIQTKTLPKGRVSTTVMLFMMDEASLDDLMSRYIKGEIKVIEGRVGVSIKHPKDKYDKKIAKAEAAKRLNKVKWKIGSLNAYTDCITLTLASEYGKLQVRRILGKGIKIYDLKIHPN